MLIYEGMDNKNAQGVDLVAYVEMSNGPERSGPQNKKFIHYWEREEMNVNPKKIRGVCNIRGGYVKWM